MGLDVEKQRADHGLIPTKAALEKSLPDNPTQLKQQMATLLVEKAVLEKELEIIKKDVSVIPGQLSNKHKTNMVDALRSTFP